MANLEHTLTKTERNLWNAIVAEAMAHLKYSAYAHKALEEGYPEVAQVFQEVAGAETIHGMNHLKVSGEIKASIENLKNVVQGESKEISTMYPRYVKDALDEGRMDAADTFTMAMDREEHHLEVFSRALEELSAKLDVTAAAEEPETQVTEPATPRMRQIRESDLSPTYAAARLEVESQRWKVAAVGRIREVVFGAQDGLLSILALVTAVAASDVEKTTVLIAALAGALSGMISMAAGAFLGSRAEQDVQRAEIEKEAQELVEHPGEELAELVVLYQREGLTFKEAQGVAEHIAADKDLWLRTMIEKELGLSPEMTTNPLKDSLAMGSAFIAGAFVPILPYFFSEGNVAIGSSIAATLSGLFVLGMVKGRVVQRSPFLQGLEILLIGAVFGGVGILLGELIPKVL